MASAPRSCDAYLRQRHSRATIQRYTQALSFARLQAIVQFKSSRVAQGGAASAAGRDIVAAQEVAAMLKFRCQHCGQRIAVPARHLGKLVTCAECGQVTHPLAEQLVKSSPAPAQPPAPAPAPLQPITEPCANCGKAIGALQSSQSWNGRRVCAPCHHLLTDESSHQGIAARVASPVEPAGVPLRERAIRGMMVIAVAVVALYGAATLLRDIAGLIAVAAVAILALLALYAVFRTRLASRAKTDHRAITAP
jgi:predicted RNA-binding Zn-ribbon protein involved in translation (DUF1610 family)